MFTCIPGCRSKAFITFGILALWVLALIVLFPATSDVYGFYYKDFSSTSSLHDSLLRTKGSTIYKERRRTLLSVCKEIQEDVYSLAIPTSKLRKRLFVDRRHNLLFCGLEKVACSFWKRVLAISTGLVTVKNPYDMPAGQAHSFPFETFQGDLTINGPNMLDSYTKVVFVRDPYSRLFSAYINKLFRANVGYFGLRRRIANYTRSKETPLSTSCAPSVSFKEFVSYLLVSLKRNKSSDGHFLPMNRLCNPCLLRYDVLGKMETFNSDLKYVLERNNLTTMIELDYHKYSFEKDIVVSGIKSLFKKRSSIEQCIPFNDAFKLLWRQFQIRGILGNDVSLPERLLSNVSSIDRDDVIISILRACRKSSSKNKTAAKQSAIQYAYSTISAKDLSEYRRLFRQDFELFGYNIEPENIFGQVYSKV